MKKTLAYTNPYIRDPVVREEMIERAAYHSSVVEGAEGLERLELSEEAARSLASSSNNAKNLVSGSNSNS